MPQNRPPDDDDVRAGLETKPFLAHLEDLRWTIIRCVGALAVGVTICAFSVKYILDALYHPYRQTGHDPKQLIGSPKWAKTLIAPADKGRTTEAMIRVLQKDAHGPDCGCIDEPKRAAETHDASRIPVATAGQGTIGPDFG